MAHRVHYYRYNMTELKEFQLAELAQASKVIPSMKNKLALGIYEYETNLGNAFGWRLVELLPHSDAYTPDVQRIKPLASMQGFSSRETATAGFGCVCVALGATMGEGDVVDVPRYGWAPRVVVSDDLKSDKVSKL